MKFSFGSSKSGSSSGAKKFGLIQPASKKIAKKTAATPSAFFSPDDDDGSTTDIQKVNESLRRQAERTAKLQFEEAQKALAEDPSIFDYDGVYDQMKEAEDAKKGKTAPSKAEPKRESRYIETILAKSKIRQREIDRVRERKLLREREEEDKLFGDKESFVTSAYKKKLIEDKYWEDADALEAKREREEDVARRGGLHNFYSNLLTKNIAMGGDVEKSSKSAYTVREKEQKQLEESEEPITARTSKGRHPEDDIADSSIIDREKKLKLDIPENELGEITSGRVDEHSSRGGLSVETEGEQKRKSDVEKVEADMDAASKKKAVEDRVAAARARYLARKQQE